MCGWWNWWHWKVCFSFPGDRQCFTAPSWLGMRININFITDKTTASATASLTEPSILIGNTVQWTWHWITIFCQIYMQRILVMCCRFCIVFFPYSRVVSQPWNCSVSVFSGFSDIDLCFGWIKISYVNWLRKLSFQLCLWNIEYWIIIVTPETKKKKTITEMLTRRTVFKGVWKLLRRKCRFV